MTIIAAGLLVAIFVGLYASLLFLLGDKQPLGSVAAPPQQDFTPPATLTISSAAQEGGVDKDCPDFVDHDDAQKYYIAQGGPARDPDRLDMDHDGLACENYQYHSRDSLVPPSTRGVVNPRFFGPDNSKVNVK